ncbi:cysteine desulfurase family protein [Ferruginibacter albus]|uniref:cysteine desulfurase family protein n=1 Tax=Ferruginibacter albus TaxID=2875540 RepID=UPI001CC58804|nr:cysteine desulfurase family protein [Ferruginibacter albus]UAY50879.1 cysteine desulfurase [Ferruginibacter albus]
MQRIYFDNAATTSLDPQVLEAMMPYLTEKFGNPSSIYSYGRETRMAVENARKSVAKILNTHPSEIFFTSCGTESTNTVLNAAVKDLECTHIITSAIEHHATLHTVQHLNKKEDVKVSYVKLLSNGQVDFTHLEELLSSSQEKTLVTLMHANNEIGNLLSIKRVGELCEKYNAYFHSDMVQTIGHLLVNLKNIHVHFVSASAHKFHGPKGAGLLYINGDVKIDPYIHGGGQERNMRAGTENIYGIVGLAKALELSIENHEKDSAYISALKKYMHDELQDKIPGVSFNGDVLEKTLYTVLSVNFPSTAKSEMLLYNLDINNVCVSGGSACSSGTNIGSHVMAAISNDPNLVTVRFSFSKHNTKEEVDTVIEKVKQLLN